MKCPNCGSTNSIKDQSRGDTICGDCGQVLEESEVVCDVAFENTKVVGSFVTDQVGGFSFAKNMHGNPMLESSEIRRSKAYHEIQKLASLLMINHYMVEMAKKYYNLASAKRFIQGRKTKHVVAVILYTVCRIQKTRHLLIDFSEVLQANLFVLGSVYLKLVRVLQITVPIVDPSLFIKRYCAKLEFGDKTNTVSSTALKMMQCMDRDWMVTGRRPSGLCGAAILIASRFHGFKRSIKEITDVVHVCDETIRRRLEEFSHTSTANLTKTEFESIDSIRDDGKGRDPPAFIKNRKKEKEALKETCTEATCATSAVGEEVVKKAKAIEKIFSDEVRIKIRSSHEVGDKENKEKVKITQETASTSNVNLPNQQFECIKLNFTKQIAGNNESETVALEVKEIKEPENTLDFQKNAQMTLNMIVEKDEPLSDIDEKEANYYFVSDEEYKLKKLLWEVLFKDWIEEQKDKKKAEKKEIKKRERKISKIEPSMNKDPVEAIISSNKFKKMNVNYLSDMFKMK